MPWSTFGIAIDERDSWPVSSHTSTISSSHLFYLVTSFPPPPSCTTSFYHACAAPTGPNPAKAMLPYLLPSHHNRDKARRPWFLMAFVPRWTHKHTRAAHDWDPRPRSRNQVTNVDHATASCPALRLPCGRAIISDPYRRSSLYYTCSGPVGDPTFT